MYVVVIGCYSPDNLLLSRFTCFLVTLCSISIPESFLSKSLTWSAWEERGGREGGQREKCNIDWGGGGGGEREQWSLLALASTKLGKPGQFHIFLNSLIKFRVTVE